MIFAVRQADVQSVAKGPFPSISPEADPWRDKALLEHFYERIVEKHMSAPKCLSSVAIASGT
jgi:hypothetical protein